MGFLLERRASSAVGPCSGRGGAQLAARRCGRDADQLGERLDLRPQRGGARGARPPGAARDRGAHGRGRRDRGGRRDPRRRRRARSSRRPRSAATGSSTSVAISAASAGHQRSGQRVEAADLHVAARADRREQRGQVVVEVVAGRPARPSGAGPRSQSAKVTRAVTGAASSSPGRARASPGRLSAYAAQAVGRARRAATGSLRPWSMPVPGALAHRVPAGGAAAEVAARRTTRRPASAPASGSGRAGRPSPPAGPASRLTCRAAVDVIIARPASRAADARRSASPSPRSAGAG